MPPKKEVKKPDKFYEVAFIVLMFILLWYVWTTIIHAPFWGSLWFSLKGIFRNFVWPVVIGFGVILTTMLIFGIIRTYSKLKEINKREKTIYHPPEPEVGVSAPVSNKNERWKRVIEHLNSANANDWRLAVIEADVMLDELLRSKGYLGDSLGEMLKAVDKSDFVTLDLAWEAHKIRNQIAHSGTDYYLTEREAKRVVGLYEQVFREFKII